MVVGLRYASHLSRVLPGFILVLWLFYLPRHGLKLNFDFMLCFCFLSTYFLESNYVVWCPWYVLTASVVCIRGRLLCVHLSWCLTSAHFCVFAAFHFLSTCGKRRSRHINFLCEVIRWIKEKGQKNNGNLLVEIDLKLLLCEQ